MIQIVDPKDCCGCTACASICAHDAIKMGPDTLGFLFPKVDTTICVECGLCEQVCAFNDNYDIADNFQQPKVYGARHKNIGEVETSRSGAVFIAISDRILESGGVVYGAGFSDHFRVVHKRAATKEERNEFKGSKYVQSDLVGVFRQIKKDLKDGLTVLFSGTPCQTAGLSSYLGKSLRNNLFLVDIICHGVPGPYLWRDYIRYLEKKQEDEIVEVNFRDKQEFGWHAHHETFRFKSDDKKKWFPNGFYKSIMFRQSCGNCHFCNTKRPSDITIGDFWGWDKLNSNINIDKKGLNLLLINTDKGKDMFYSVQEKLNVIAVNSDIYMQPNLVAPTRIHKKRNKFEQDYQNRGFEYVFTHEYDERPLWRQVASYIYQSFKKLV